MSTPDLSALHEHVLGAFYARPRPYPEPLPEALAPWHVYPPDAGHSILCVRAEDAEQANGSIPADYLMPVPVRTVLRHGYEAVDMGLPAPVVVVPGLTYDPDLGLVVPPDDDEY